MLIDLKTTRPTEQLPVYLFSFHRAPHRAELLQHAEREEDFTDSLVMAGVIADFDLTLLSFDGEVFTRACLFTSANRASTGKRRGKFQFIRTLPVPIAVKQALTRTKQRPSAIDSTERIASTVVIDVTAEKLHLWIRREFPPDVPVLDELFRLRARLFDSRGDAHRLALSEQRDCAGVLLDIAGQDRRGILGQADLQETTLPRSFIDKLPPSTIKTDERRIVEHDMRMFADWREVEPAYTTTRVYRDEQSIVTLLYVDSSDIERIAGVDLIYHFDTYDSLVMIQYKRMYEGVYRPDSRCHDQNARMSQVYTLMQAAPSGRLVESDFRLSKNPFFFKVCDGRVPLEFNKSLLEGMYFPQEHWQYVLGPHDDDAPKYGRPVSRKTAPRWLSNTEFVNVARKGWIGSEPAAGRHWVQGLVQQCLDDDHAVVLGRIMNVDPPPSTVSRPHHHQGDLFTPAAPR
jgi:hypothetical protein